MAEEVQRSLDAQFTNKEYWLCPGMLWTVLKWMGSGKPIKQIILLNNASHPIQAQLVKQWSTFSERLHCSKE